MPILTHIQEGWYRPHLTKLTQGGLEQPYGQQLGLGTHRLALGAPASVTPSPHEPHSEMGDSLVPSSTLPFLSEHRISGGERDRPQGREQGWAGNGEHVGPGLPGNWGHL